MVRRNTVQRDLVLTTVRKLHRHVTADEVYNEIVKDYPSVGRGTVYRNLNVLAEAGDIRKLEIPGEADRFDFFTAEHYHVKCIRCKKVFDVEMDVIPNLLDKVKDKHGVEFIDCNIIFTGICPDCQKETKQ